MIQVLLGSPERLTRAHIAPGNQPGDTTGLSQIAAARADARSALLSVASVLLGLLKVKGSKQHDGSFLLLDVMMYFRDEAAIIRTTVEMP